MTSYRTVFCSIWFCQTCSAFRCFFFCLLLRRWAELAACSSNHMTQQARISTGCEVKGLLLVVMLMVWVQVVFDSNFQGTLFMLRASWHG